MRRHLLSMLQRTTVGEIRRDARRSKRMIADRRVNANRHRAPTDHPPSIRLRHGLFSQLNPMMPAGGAEQEALAILGDAGRVDIGRNASAKA